MICFRCRGVPRRLREMAEYGTAVLTARREAETETYMLCPSCYAEVRRCIWGEDTNDEMREMQAADRPGGAARPGMAAAGDGGHGQDARI